MILADSVISDCLGNGRTEGSSTPFIDNLINDGVYAKNVYSCGPYTDAATKALYTGEPTLDNYGYYYQINNAKCNMYEIFHNAGYETYGFYYPYYLISSNIKKYIDHSVYLSGMVFSSIWNGKLSFYAEIQKIRKLSATEYHLVKRLLNIQFEAWENFYIDILNYKDSRVIIESNTSIPQIQRALSQIMKEKRKFILSPRTYIDDVLKMGMNHRLATINCVNMDKTINKHYIKNIYSKNSTLFIKAAKIEKKRNLANNKFSLTKAMKGMRAFLLNHEINELRYSINFIRCLYAVEEMKKSSLNDGWQLIASARKQIDGLISILNNRKNTTPFFASVHFLEAHNPVSCFSYDIMNESYTNEEMEALDKTISSCGEKFAGNITYQMSLSYIDLCVKKLYSYLQGSGLLYNTTILLVADHGSSFSYYPLRKQVVNTFHTENYKTPMILWNLEGHIKKKDENHLWSAIDVLPTLLHGVGVPIPSTMKGFDIVTNDEGRQYVITEYMGPGCPDMLEREVWISARDDSYVVGVRQRIDQKFMIDNITTVYYLENDPDEKHNLVQSNYKIDEIQYLLDAIRNRFEEIQRNTTQSVHNLLLEE